MLWVDVITSAITMRVVGIWADHRRIRFSGRVLPSPPSFPCNTPTHTHTPTPSQTRRTRPLPARRRRVSLRLARLHQDIPPHHPRPVQARAVIAPLPLPLHSPGHLQARPPSKRRSIALGTKSHNSASLSPLVNTVICEEAPAACQALFPQGVYASMAAL